jgi:hypothetical protein
MVFIGETLEAHMTSPTRALFKDNEIVDWPISIAQFNDNTSLFLTFLVSFDQTTSKFPQSEEDLYKPVNYNMTLTLQNNEFYSYYNFNLLVPVQPQLGYLRSVAEFKHYQLSGNIQQEDYDEKETTYETQSTLLAAEQTKFSTQLQTTSIYDITPLITLSNITIPYVDPTTLKPIYEFDTITITTIGFLDFELVNNNGDVHRDQTIKCAINNIEVTPTFKFESGPTNTTVMVIEILPIFSTALQKTMGSTISLDCPFQLILTPKYPNLNVNSPHISNLPFGLTITITGTKDHNTYNFSASTLIQPTTMFLMSQPTDYARPLTELVIKDSYFDSNVLYCKLQILHEWNRAFGFQDLIEAYVFNVVPSGTMTIERRPVQSDHYRNATPNTAQFSLALPKEPTTDTRPALPMETTYTTGTFPLNVDSVNKKSKDHGIAVLIAVPLKPEQKFSRDSLAQCGFIYSQFYGQKSISKTTPQQSEQQQTKMAKMLTHPTLRSTQQTMASSQQEFASTAFSLSTKFGLNQTRQQLKLNDLPPTINSLSLLSTSFVRYIPPVATSISFNVSDVNGPIQFEVYLKDFQSTPVTTGMFVLEFPSQSYTFKGDFICHFNDLKVRGSGIDARTGDELTYFNIKFDFEDISRAFPPGKEIKIQCSSTVLVPTWSNYYYISATVPIRVMIYDDTTKTNLVASSSTITDLPATRKYIVIVIVLSVIGFFFLLTVILTKICNGLIDRLHRHKVHVIQYNNNVNSHNNNSNASLRSGLGPAEALASSSAAFFTNFTHSSGPYEQLVDDNSQNNNTVNKQPQRNYDFEIPLRPGK